MDPTAILDPGASQHEILARLARLLPVNRYLEIGVRDGCTVWVVCEAHRPSLIACADDWGEAHGGTARGNHSHIDQLFHAIGYYLHGGQVVWLDGLSQETLPQFLLTTPDTKFDLIHVDGNHDTDPAYFDLVNSWPLLALNGAMVIHDTIDPNVRTAINRFLDTVNARTTYHTAGRGTAVVWKKEAPQ